MNAPRIAVVDDDVEIRPACGVVFEVRRFRLNPQRDELAIRFGQLERGLQNPVGERSGVEWNENAHEHEEPPLLGVQSKGRANSQQR